MKTHSLENRSFRIEVVPGQGGRIESIMDRISGKEWVWHPDGYEPTDRPLPIGASFDDNWRGGWEEVFPNDAAGPFEGYSLVDHGELWSQPWSIIEKDSSGIKMSYRCERVPVEVEKTIVLSDSAPSFRLHYLFRSHAERPLPFLFKLHPAIAIEPGDEILLPDCSVEPVSLDFSTLIGRNEKTRFPYGVARSGDQIRLDRILPRGANAQEFYYATGLSEGWAGIRNHRTNTELKFRFDRKDIPNVWIFESFGKWRNHYTLLMEPCTNVPWDLNEALKRRTCAILEPGKKREYHFEVVIIPSQTKLNRE
jgi:hypothetical protein